VLRADECQVTWPPPEAATEAHPPKARPLCLLLFNDVLLLAERAMLGGKLVAFQWCCPLSVSAAPPGEPIGTLHVQRMASGVGGGGGGVGGGGGGVGGGSKPAGSAIGRRSSAVSFCGGGPRSATAVATSDARETVSFSVPAAEAARWLEELQRSIDRSAGGRDHALSFATGGGGTAAGGPCGNTGGHGLSFQRGASALPPPELSNAQSAPSVGLGARGVAESTTSMVRKGAVGMSVGTGSGVLAGWLQKKGGSGSDGERRNWAKGGRRNWKWRWVVISSSQFISWFDSEKCRALKGSLALHGAQVSPSDKQNGFWVLTNTRSLELLADSADKASRWIEVLQATANQAPRSMKAPRPEDGGTAAAAAAAVAAAAAQPPPGVPPPPAGPTPPASPLAHSPGSLGGEGTPARRKYARALYDFDAERDDDLSLRPGDVLEVLSDEGAWWVGVLGERHGHFPSNFVEEYIPPEPLEPPPQFGRQMSSLI
jgi:hypothetical protein